MNLAFLLHIYQPSYQKRDVLDRIVNESYRPLLAGLHQTRRGKITISINTNLLDMFAQGGYQDVISSLHQLLINKKIEITGTYKHHIIAPLLPKGEIIRQINLQTKGLLSYFGNDIKTKTFFPTELAIDSKSMSCIVKEHFKSVCVSENCLMEPQRFNVRYVWKDHPEVTVLIRDKLLSNLILTGYTRSASSLLDSVSDLVKEDELRVLVMDGETFGHHRVGQEDTLFDILESTSITTHLLSDLSKTAFFNKLPVVPVAILPSSWSNVEQDGFKPQYFWLWKDPANNVHRRQWQLVAYVTAKLNNFRPQTSQSWRKARVQFSKALASDQFWWASGKPWWSYEYIEDGAANLLKVLKLLYPKASSLKPGLDIVSKGEKLYRLVTDTAIAVQKSPVLKAWGQSLIHDKAVLAKPFKLRVPLDFYNQIILELDHDISEAVKLYEFEKAVMLRDIAIKIWKGTDVLDPLNVLDIFWFSRKTQYGNLQVKPFLEHTWSEFSEFSKAHFLGVTCEQDFLSWKNGGVVPTLEKDATIN